MSPLKKSIDDAGGVSVVAVACGKTSRAVYKWLSAGSLPRTEYTGETQYAAQIAALAAGKGKPFSSSWLLAEAHPNKNLCASTLSANVRSRVAEGQTAKTSVNPSSILQACP